MTEDKEYNHESNYYWLNHSVKRRPLLAELLCGGEKGREEHDDHIMIANTKLCMNEGDNTLPKVED